LPWNLRDLFNQPLTTKEQASKTAPGKAGGGPDEAAGADTIGTSAAGTRVEREGAFVSQQALVSIAGTAATILLALWVLRRLGVTYEHASAVLCLVGGALPFYVHKTDRNGDSDPRYPVRVAIKLVNTLADLRGGPRHQHDCRQAAFAARATLQ
jgi:hypothetical protein